MAEEEEKNVETTDQVPEDVGEGGAGGSAPSPDQDQAQNVREATGSADDSEQADGANSNAGGESSTPEAAPVAPAEPDPLDDLPRKERNRILKSRKPHQARPQRSAEERQAERDAERKRKAAQRSKRRAEAKAEAKKGAGTGTPPAEHESNLPKTRQGIVVSNKADKTITVRIDIARRHKVYEKIVRQSRTLHVHDERNEASEGDTVRVVETRPLSKTKRWRLVEIVEKAR